MSNSENRQMRDLCQLQSNILLTLVALGGALFFHQADAAIPCTDLPPSSLRLYDIKAPTVQVAEVSAADLKHSAQGGSPVSQHTLMLTTNTVAAWFDIAHRILARPDGSVCDSPSLVRMGFGS